MRAFGAGDVYRRPVHRNYDGFIRALNIKRVAAGLPPIRLLVLIAVDDLLLEKAVFVIDAVSEAGHAEGCERLKEAGGKTSETAVAESGIEFAVEDFFEIDAFLVERLAAQLEQLQVAKAIAEGASHQEFHGDVIETLGVRGSVALLGD